MSVVWVEESSYNHDAGSDYAYEYEYSRYGEQECQEAHQEFFNDELISRGWPGCLGTVILHYL